LTTQELETARKKAQAAYHREWRRKNPEKVKEANRKYWAKKAAAMEAARNEQTETD